MSFIHRIEQEQVQMRLQIVSTQYDASKLLEPTGTAMYKDMDQFFHNKVLAR
jgi:hypothetical protein